MDKLKFVNGLVQDYTVVLSTRDYRHLGQLGKLKNVNSVGNLSSASEFSFSISKYDLLRVPKESIIPPATHVRLMKELWEQIIDFKLIWVKELDKYYEIRVSLDDSTETIKTVTAVSLCEAELGQTLLYNLEVNTEIDIARDAYDVNFPTIFYRDPEDVEAYKDIWQGKDWEKYTVYKYDEDGNVMRYESISLERNGYILTDNDNAVMINNSDNSMMTEGSDVQSILGDKIIDEEATLNKRKDIIRGASFIHRVLEKAPHYTIGHIDESLKNLQRTFSADSTAIYDILTGEAAEQFGCLFVFDSTSRTISVYDLYSVCNNQEATKEKIVTDDDGNVVYDDSGETPLKEEVVEPCGYRGEDLKYVCATCGHEVDYNSYCPTCQKQVKVIEVCPKCGSADLTHFGKDTTIYIDKTNLTDQIHLECNADNVKNCFKLVAGDELMTATIRMLNQNGSDYLYRISDYQKNDMPKEMLAKLEQYDKDYQSYTEEYEDLMRLMYDYADEKLYLESGMMPTIDQSEVTAGTEMAKLTVEALSPLGLSAITKATSVATVNTAVKNFASTLIKTGYVKLEIISESNNQFVPDKNADGVLEVTDGGFHTGTWYGRIKITNYSDENDTATTKLLTLQVNDDMKTFAEQKVMKNISDELEESTVFDVLNCGHTTCMSDTCPEYLNGNGRYTGNYFGECPVCHSKNNVKCNNVECGTESAACDTCPTCGDTDLTDVGYLVTFKEYLTYYSLNRLISFRDAIEGALSVMQSMGIGVKDKDSNSDLIEGEVSDENIEITAKILGLEELYKELYKPYYDKLKAVEAEIDVRQEQLDNVQKRYDSVQERMFEIQNILNLETYLGEEYYHIFCSYRREDTYENANYISDGLSNTELIEKAKEFIEVAKQELLKASEPEYTLTSTLYNLLVLPEFEPILDNFELGNWLRIQVDGVLYKLRLIHYDLSFDNIQNLGVEFSNVSRVHNVVNEAKQILQSAQSMATSYGYVAKQAYQGSSAKTELNTWYDTGINSGLINITNNDKEEVTYGKHGILCRSWDDINEVYDDKQLKITHNTMVFTSDGWKTIRQVIGEHNYITYNPETNAMETHTGYGVTADFLNATILSSMTMYGGQIYSMNYKLNEDGSCHGTYIDLETGTFSFGDGGLKYNPEEGLFLNSKAIEDALAEVNITAENLKIKPDNIDGLISLSKIFGTSNGQITSNQIESLDADKISGLSVDVGNISGTISLDQIEEITFEDISGTITSEQIGEINFKDIAGVATAEQIEDLDASKITTGKLASARIATTLSGKTLDNAMLSDATFSNAFTVTDNNESYYGLSEDVVVGENTLKFVNGILVAIG